MACDEPGRQRVCGHPSRAPACGPRGRQPDASPERGRVQPDGQTRGRGLRPALHQRQRLWIQQWRRTEPEQPGSDTASRFDHNRHPAHRSAQPLGHAWRERPRRLHDSKGQQIRLGPERVGRNLRLRIPQRPQGVMGHRRDHVRQRHWDEPHRGGQYRPQRRELRLDEEGWMRSRRQVGEVRCRSSRPEQATETRAVPVVCGLES